MGRMKDRAIELGELQLETTGELINRIIKLRERANRAEDRVLELEQNFRCFASHDEGCSILTVPHDCSCGYRDVLKGLTS